MSQFARVDSIETLREFRLSLCRFLEVIKNALAEAESEILRTGIWLEREQTAYWKNQIRQNTEKVAQAKILLKRKQIQKTPLGGRYSTVEEEKALAVAERRLEIANEKQANVRRWMRKLEEETFLYKGQVQGLALAIEADMPNAIAKLDHMTASLESYVSAPTPADQNRATNPPATSQAAEQRDPGTDPASEQQSDPT